MKRSDRATVSVAGLIATLLLHSLFFAVAMWGGMGIQAIPDRPDAVGAGANRGQPGADSSEQRITVRMIHAIEATKLERSSDALSAEQLRRMMMLEITGPDALALPPLVAVESGVPVESSEAEMIARAEMVGVYQSQIRARIERAWSLPESTPADLSFSCRPLIRQRKDGRVDEVELPYEGCEGALEMRQSLMRAIFAASPLPAPPNAAVFVDSFSMVFNSEAVRRHTSLSSQIAAPPVRSSDN